MPLVETKNAWKREYLAREEASRGFDDAEPDDWIFLSDVDEIWRPEKRDESPKAMWLAYEMFHCYYKLNTPRVPHHDWLGTRRCRKRDWIGGQTLRCFRDPRIKDGGWHFSFLGDAEAAATKMESYAHTEYSGGLWTNRRRIAECIESGEDLIVPSARYDPVPIDETFPKPILEDRQRWSRYIAEVK